MKKIFSLLLAGMVVLGLSVIFAQASKTDVKPTTKDQIQIQVPVLIHGDNPFGVPYEGPGGEAG